MQGKRSWIWTANRLCYFTWSSIRYHRNNHGRQRWTECAFSPYFPALPPFLPSDISISLSSFLLPQQPMSKVSEGGKRLCLPNYSASSHHKSISQGKRSQARNYSRAGHAKLPQVEQTICLIFRATLLVKWWHVLSVDFQGFPGNSRVLWLQWRKAKNRISGHGFVTIPYVEGFVLLVFSSVTEAFAPALFVLQWKFPISIRQGRVLPVPVKLLSNYFGACWNDLGRGAMHFIRIQGLSFSGSTRIEKIEGRRTPYE